MGQVATYLKELLYPIAEVSAGILELIGIVIIIVGSFRALILLIKRMIEKKPFHVATDLGKALSLALEFKMGAEIIKTVIIHNLEELAILGIVMNAVLPGKDFEFVADNDKSSEHGVDFKI